MKKMTALAMMFAATTAFASDDCKFTVEANDKMQFNTKEIKVPASCEAVTVTLKHVGKLPVQSMGHNWVLAETANLQAVVSAGMKKGAAAGYLDESDKNVIAHTKLLGGGEEDSVEFKTEGLTGKDMTFFCSFPGHSAIMKGKFIVE